MAMLMMSWYKYCDDGFFSDSFNQHQNYINSSCYAAFFIPIILCNLFCSQFWTGALLQSLNPHKLHSGVARTYMRRRMRRGRGGESLKPHNLSSIGQQSGGSAGFCFRFFLTTCLLGVNTSPYIFSSWYTHFSNWSTVRQTR